MAWEASNKKCPHCRTENFPHIRSLPLKREIDGFKIHCDNYKQGCKEILALGDLQKHLEDCLFVTVSCDNECGVIVFRKDLITHLVQDCPNRKVPCQHCGLVDRHIVIMDSHLMQCPDVPLTCPNNCGAVKIKQKNIPTHKQKCPLEPVECPFFEAGCTNAIPRKDLEAHAVSSIQNHLQLVMIANTNNYAVLEVKHEMLQSQHLQLQEKFDTVMTTASQEIDSIDKTQTNTALQCIKTMLVSSTAMLGPSPTKYSLHFLRESDTSFRTHPFHLKPGYKVYLRCDKVPTRNIRVYDVNFLLVLEKTDADDSLPWPIPNNMEIQIKPIRSQSAPLQLGGQSFLYAQPQTKRRDASTSICSDCNPDVNLKRVSPGYAKQAILTIAAEASDGRLIDGIRDHNGFYANMTLTEHTC